MSVIIRIVLQLVVVIIYARLLGPEPLGFLSLATMILGVGGIFVAFGIGDSLVQKEVLVTKDISSALNIILTLAIVASALLVIFAGKIALFFGDYGLRSYVMSLGAYFPIFALNVVAKSLLKREMELKRLALVQVFGYFVGFVVVGLPMVLAGFKESTLVLALISQELIILLLLWHKVKGRIVLFSGGFSFSGISFGLDVLKTNVANWIIENIDNLLIGRVRGVADLGIYSVSYNLVRTPVNHFVTTVDAVLFPATARLQGESASVKKMFYAILGVIGVVVLPVFIGIASVSGTLVDALYGEQWALASKVLVPISLSMPLHALVAITGPMLWGLGRADREFIIAFRLVIFMVPALYLAAQVSLVSAAWCVFAFYLMRAVLMLAALVKCLGLSWIKIVRSLKGGVSLSLIVAPALGIMESMLVEHSYSSLARFILLLTLGASLFFIGLALFKRLVMTPEMKELGMRVRGRIKVSPVVKAIDYLVS